MARNNASHIPQLIRNFPLRPFIHNNSAEVRKNAGRILGISYMLCCGFRDSGFHTGLLVNVRNIPSGVSMAPKF